MVSLHFRLGGLAIFLAIFGQITYAQTTATGSPEPVNTPAPNVMPASLEPLATLIHNDDFRTNIRPIGDLRIDIRTREVRGGKKKGEVPTDHASQVLDTHSVALKGHENRCWDQICAVYEASQLCHQPLYFEDTNLERYGYSPRGLRLAQPGLSCVRFFLTVPALPYLMAAHPPRETIYVLGNYEPGSPVPYQRVWPPFKPLAGVVEAGVWVGLVFLIP